MHFVPCLALVCCLLSWACTAVYGGKVSDDGWLPPMPLTQGMPWLVSRAAQFSHVVIPNGTRPLAMMNDRDVFRNVSRTTADHQEPAADAWQTIEHQRIATKQNLPLRHSQEGRGEGGLWSAVWMVLVSELGDKTFFTAAVLAMRHRRTPVFAGAWGALAFMSVLAAGLGQVLPLLLSRTWSQRLAAALFLGFGILMVREAFNMDPQEAASVEAEVEAELREAHDPKGLDASSPHASERLATPLTMGSRETTTREMFTEAFMLTFLAEWGDRSQLATVAMAASDNMWCVMVGTVVGHACCTGIAVLGGKILAAHLSARVVAILGGISFLGFGLTHGLPLITAVIL